VFGVIGGIKTYQIKAFKLRKNAGFSLRPAAHVLNSRNGEFITQLQAVQKPPSRLNESLFDKTFDNLCTRIVKGRLAQRILLSVF